MRWLVRTVTRTRKGAVSKADDSFVGETLSVGRGAGQAVFVSDLRVALEHARIVPLKGQRFRVESLVAAGVRVDGKLQSAAGAGVGSTLIVGGTQIELIEPPAGFDAAVELSDAPETRRGDTPDAARRTSLDQTWLNKRGTAWLLFLALITIGLVIPVVGSQLPEIGKVLRDTPGAPSDGQWEAGTLQAAHHFFGQDCENCHVKPFTRVRDEQCVSCHTATAAHADASFFELPELEDTPCGTCHRDHNGLDGLIVDRQSLCTDCHDDLSTATNGTTLLGNVHDFTDEHPQFKVELANWAADGTFRPRRESLDSATLSEDSNLRFPHDVHLDPAGIAAPDGDQVLACGDCHQPEPGGALMVEVDFETMCHDCHRLGFDPSAPDREVPHGDAAQVQFMLQGYFADRALRGAISDSSAPEVVRKRRRPGEAMTRQERLEITAWADERAYRTTQGLFEGQACGVCHTVSREDDGANVSWQIAPVRVAGTWFTAALFTHGSHTTMECASCHAAGVSETSNDVLIPGIDTSTFKGETVIGCRDCHGGEAAKDKVASPCIDCHRYHAHESLTLAGS